MAGMMGEPIHKIQTAQSDLTPLIHALRLSTGLRINHIKKTIISTAPGDFARIESEHAGNSDILSSLIYFIWLFRGVPEIHTILNDSAFPNSLLERVILFAQGRFLVQDSSQESFLKESFPFLQAQKSMELILDSEWIKQDIMLVMHLMVNFNLRTIDDFFGRFQTAEEANFFFLQFLERLKSYDLNYFFIRNPDLFLYVFQLFEVYRAEPRIQTFLDNYLATINNMREVKNLANFMLVTYDQADANNPTNKLGRRCEMLVNRIRKFANIEQVITMLTGMNVFQSGIEKSIVTEFLLNEQFSRGAGFEASNDEFTVEKTLEMTGLSFF